MRRIDSYEITVVVLSINIVGPSMGKVRTKSM